MVISNLENLTILGVGDGFRPYSYSGLSYFTTIVPRADVPLDDYSLI